MAIDGRTYSSMPVEAAALKYQDAGPSDGRYNGLPSAHTVRTVVRRLHAAGARGIVEYAINKIID